MTKGIFIDIENNYFILTGNIASIMQNRRLLMSFKRLNYSSNDEIIKIPFDSKIQIKILQDIQDLLEKFWISFEFKDNTKNELNSYNIEQENFKLFSSKARDIRNDNFWNNPKLISDFESFLLVLKEKMLSRDLYTLQKLSAFHMAFSQNSCNFAVPWAWKTSIVYGAYIYLKNLPKDDPRHIDKILVIWPLSSFAPWENEYKDCFWVNIESQRLSWDSSISREHKEQHLYSNNPKELTLISHWWVSILENQIIDFLKKNKTMVVIDEAHRIKNAKWVWGQSVVEISKEAKSRVILTWTPVPNWYEDLYNLYRFIYPFKFQEILQFHYDQLRELTKNATSIDDNRVQNLIENINPYFIRIKKKDLNLPIAIENTVLVDMDESQREIYDYIEEKYIKSFQSNSSWSIKDILNKAKLIRLRQAAINPSLLLKSLQESLEDSEYWRDPNIDYTLLNDEGIDDSSILDEIINYKDNIPNKFKKIEEILKTKIFPNKGKVIIWTIFIQNTDELESFLNKKWIKTKILIGRIPQDEREIIIEDFNNPDNLDFQVVIANPFSVSESISLHKWCHNAIYMERDYNCANFLQSKDRIHRVWLPENTETNYYYLVSKNSIDSIIHDKLDDKVKRMQKIIDDEIPLFKRINDDDETDIINLLLKKYAWKS